MIKIPGGPSIIEEKKNTIPYEETELSVNYWCGQNEGNLFVYKLEDIEFVVNIELDEVYGVLVKKEKDVSIYPLSVKHEELLKKNKIPYNMWVTPYYGISQGRHIIPSSLAEMTEKHRGNHLNQCTITSAKFIGEKLFFVLNRATNISNTYQFNCYDNGKEYGLNFQYLHYPYIFKLYFDIVSSEDPDSWSIYPELIKYQTFTSKYMDGKDGERKRILGTNRRYVVDRNTNKVIGKEERLLNPYISGNEYYPDKSQITPLDKDYDVPFLTKLNLL